MLVESTRGAADCGWGAMMKEVYSLFCDISHFAIWCVWLELGTKKNLFELCQVSTERARRKLRVDRTDVENRMRLRALRRPAIWCFFDAELMRARARARNASAAALWCARELAAESCEDGGGERIRRQRLTERALPSWRRINDNDNRCTRTTRARAKW